MLFSQGFSTGLLHADKSVISNSENIRNYIENWQFLSMNTFLMGNPLPQKKTGGKNIFE